VVICVHLLMEIGGFVGTLEDEIEADEEDPRSSRRGRDDMDEHDDDDDGLSFEHLLHGVGSVELYLTVFTVM